MIISPIMIIPIIFCIIILIVSTVVLFTEYENAGFITLFMLIFLITFIVINVKTHKLPELKLIEEFEITVKNNKALSVGSEYNFNEIVSQNLNNGDIVQKYQYPDHWYGCIYWTSEKYIWKVKEESRN